MPQKYALVTGGSGFLGTNLVNRLLKDKRRVKILDIKESQTDKADFILGDIRNLDDVLKSAQGANVIFHLASVIPKLDSKREIYKEVIVNGTENVLKACEKYKIKLVHISSSAVYGANRSGALKESDEKKPYEGYGKSKWEAEKLCQKYAKKGVKVVILRPIAIVGPHMNGIAKTLFKFIHYNLPLITIGSGNNKIQMLSVSDCVDAILKAEKYNKSGDVLNLGSENVPTSKHQLEEVVKRVKSKSLVVSIPAYPAKKFFEILHNINLTFFVPEHYEMFDKNSILDISKAKRNLEWKPKKDNTQMMAEAYNWYKENK